MYNAHRKHFIFVIIMSVLCVVQQYVFNVYNIVDRLQKLTDQLESILCDRLFNLFNRRIDVKLFGTFENVQECNFVSKETTPLFIPRYTCQIRQ